MPTHPKPNPRPVGRPKMSEGEAKGKVIPIRFNAEDVKMLTAAAKINGQTISEWIRNAVNTALLQALDYSNRERGPRSPESRRIRRELRDILGHRGGLRGKV